jgi:hypothetical protein
MGMGSAAIGLGGAGIGIGIAFGALIMLMPATQARERLIVLIRHFGLCFR